ncbi:MAG: tripartite tricarboxylate transporter substrate-binding protein [Pseudomonadota bacterium]
MFRSLTACALALGLAVSTSAVAEWTPPGPIKMMIAFAAGGGADTQGRMIAEELEARHGWKIIPEQVTGKGGSVLAKAMVDQPNDGTVIGLLVTESIGYNMVVAENPGYAVDDFTYLTTTAGFQMGVVAKSEKGWNTFADVVAAAKGGEAIRFGVMSPKLADLAYLLGEAHGVEFNIISVRGGKAVMNGLNAGDMDIGWGAGIQNKAVAAGDMVNLAYGLSTKLNISPTAPTMAELGVDFNADGYFLFVGPAGMPEDAASAISSAIAEIAQDTESKAGGFIGKAFGGAAVLQGEPLVQFMADGVADSEALMAATE